MGSARLASRRARQWPLPAGVSLARPSLALILLAVFAVVICIGGGASMADVPGQAVVRGGAALSLVLLLLFGARPTGRSERPALILVGAALVWVLIQLIPLPPSIWLQLPGRALFAEAARVAGEAQPWRPLAIVPSGAANAAAALIVPLTTVVLIAALRGDERAWLPTVLLAVITASALVGLIQATGATYENPLINDEPGVVSGTFANRNHFSLLMAIGCVMAPVWACLNPRKGIGWRGPLALCLVLLFVMLIVIGGSRAGLPLGALAVVLGLVIVQAPLRVALRGYPRWLFPALLLLVALGTAGLIWASISADRAISVTRAVQDDVAGDVRLRAAPTIVAMTRHYFPIGIGAGGFDPVFRLHEPFDLLQLTYWNHAHNDFLEVVLEHGVAGVLLLFCAIGWWVWGSARAWRAWFAGQGAAALLGCAASVAMLLIALASIVDYPARTPLVMFTLVVLSSWLAGVPERAREASAPLG